MDIKTVQERSKQLLEIKRGTWCEGILDTHDYGVHLLSRLFLKLISSEKYIIHLFGRQDKEFPYQASFIYEGTTYFAVLTEQEYQQNIEILGGKDNESITTA